MVTNGLFHLKMNSILNLVSMRGLLVRVPITITYLVIEVLMEVVYSIIKIENMGLLQPFTSNRSIA